VLLRHASGGAWAIALYNTVVVRDQVMTDLRSRLAPLPVYNFTFTAERANPLAYLEQLPTEVREKRTIVFLYDLTRGGERVWGYLEMQREALADHPHGLIFWLTLGERGEAVRRAPNFWSQRSGVFDFTIVDETALAQARGQWAGQPVRFVDRADWERQVRLYQGLLEEYRRSDDVSVDTLLDLYDKLFRLHHVVGNYRRSDELAHRQLTLAGESDNRAGLAASYNNIGLIYADRGDYEAALEWYQKSVEIAEELGDRAGLAISYNNIGWLYLEEGNLEQGAAYLEKALALAEQMRHSKIVKAAQEGLARARR
jgi:tetratricopeptide (TPR) repeat protein